MYATWISEISLIAAGEGGPLPVQPLPPLSGLPPSPVVIGTPGFEHLSGDADLHHHGHMSESGGRTPDTIEASRLLVLTHSRPAEALTQTRALLSRRPLMGV
jgi:hypothetical protein